MKTLILFFLPIFLSAQSLFEEIKIVDEFGDVTGSAIANLSTGTFSNSATNNSRLVVRTILEEYNYKTLDEYRIFVKKQLEDMGFSESLIKKIFEVRKQVL